MTETTAAPASSPPDEARANGLRYVSDTDPGIRRRRSGKGFAYRLPDGSPVRDRETLARIRKLAIPPAYTDVWICPDPRGHLQASGRDQRGRKQYRYHPRWKAARAETKYNRMLAFGRALPRIRKRVEAGLAQRGLTREKVLAAIVRLLEATLIRIGNDEYARENKSFGLTTLRKRHVDVEGGAVRFEFKGKSGRLHRTAFRDPRIARIVRSCQDLPGHRLFQYVDDEGERHAVGSEEVNEYLRGISGQDFTAKDFRTWAGTLLAAEILATQGEPEASPTKAAVVRCIEQVAVQLGNTPAVCRACYVHPGVVAAFLDGELATTLRWPPGDDPDGRRGEAALLRFLKRLEAETPGRA
ncbi:DNA topoisomerase IB [Inquilinus limosus]|uniref:DNA topoisomerase n=1 Tax=Inquilinus limosus MP06 TaxID=1398085 RepID=A0A0A0D7A6_9PROT|nr:DNA topoisomerase IB [Inquilinus limosus]KGM32842.1 DNA topoisomerase I [Inquilinus limosus MP06]